MPAMAMQEGEPIGPAEIDREDDHQIGRDHREFALREIDDAGGAKDQHEAERDERVDRADAEAREQQLQNEIHQVASPRSGAYRAGEGLDRSHRAAAQSVNSICLSKTIAPFSLRTIL